MNRGKSKRLAARLSRTAMVGRAGYDIPALPFKRGSHVVQRAAPPAREPCPVAVDVVARAITPACVEQPMSVTTVGFRTLGFVFFCAGATFFVRLPSRFFVSQNSRPFFCSPFLLLRPHITGVTADFEVMLIQRRESKRRVGPYGPCEQSGDSDLSARMSSRGDC